MLNANVDVFFLCGWGSFTAFENRLVICEMCMFNVDNLFKMEKLIEIYDFLTKMKSA